MWIRGEHGHAHLQPPIFRDQRERVAEIAKLLGFSQTVCHPEWSITFHKTQSMLALWIGENMLGSGLYYPHIDIADPNWLRSAVLFWDELQTIAPRAVRTPYKTKDTNILWKEGFLEPLRCDLHPELLDTLGKRVVALMDNKEFGLKLGRKGTVDPSCDALLQARELGLDIEDQFHRAHIHPGKLSPQLRDLALRSGLARMHPEKLSPHLRHLLGDLELLAMHPEKMAPGLRGLLHNAERWEDNDGEWLLVDNRFAEIYMSALAALLAKETDLAPLTNEEPSMGVNLHTLLEDVKPSAPSRKKGALVSLVMEAIRVDPNTRIEKLLAFRRAREDQLADLSAQFDDISSKIRECESGRELQEQAQNTYITRIRPKLNALRKELKDNSIQSIWDGVQRAVTISVPAGGALSYFTNLHGLTLLGAGIAVAITDIAVKSHLAQRKTRRASPYTYLLEVEKKFSVAA
jgi:hypothetical protein